MNDVTRNGGSGGGRDRRLWLFLLPIAAWGLHFLIAYVSAAIYCARFPAADSLTAVRLVILAATLATLAVLGIAARHAGRRYRSAPRSEREDRFVGSTVLLLCTLSAFATMAVASVALFFGDCRS